MALYWRLRIRNADDDGDTLVISSVSGGTNPYVVAPPTGDGQELDPLRGTFTVAAYQIRVIDANTSGSARVVTDQLADADGRTQLLSRRAYIESSANGSDWDVLVPGWVNQIRLVTPITYEVTVGETRRLEQTRKIFTEAADGTGYHFSRVTNFIGTPVKGGAWGPIPDYGQSRWTVTAVETDYVVLTLKSAVMYDAEQGLFRTYTSGFPDDQVGVVNKRAAQWFERLETPVGTFPSDSQGWFPAIAVDVYGTGYSLFGGTFTPLAAPQATGGRSRDLGYNLLLGRGPSLRLDWTTSQPTVGQDYDLDLYATKIGPDNPLHWEGHPVDFAASCLAAIGESVDATSITTVKAALGNDLYVLYRFIEEQTVGPLLESACYGPFGFCPRIKSDGSYEFVTTRLRPASAPSETIDTSVVVDLSTVAYDTDESSQVNWLVWKQQRFLAWSDPAQGEQPPDFVLSQPQTYQPDAEDTELAAELATYGQHEVTYELPGGLASSITYHIDSVGTLMDIPRYVQGVHRQIYDLYGRGRESSNAAVYRAAISANIGDYVTVTLPYKPGADPTQTPTMQRGTSRVMQVAKKTPGAGRDTFKFLDSGGTATAGDDPEFTIAKSTARPRNVATVTLTNGSTLVTAGVERVRVEYALGASPTSGVFVGYMDPAVDTTLDLPAAPSGSVVNARMRGETKGQAPTAYTAFDDVTLDSLPTPGDLTAGAGADDTETLLTWTVSDASVPVIVRWKLDAEDLFTHSVTLPPGSTQYVIHDLIPGEDYDAEVVTTESLPYVGESAAASVSFTQGGTTPTCAAPINPAVFAGTPQASGPALIDGTYGLEVTAVEIPSAVEFWVAVETSAGSGTPGTYTLMASVTAVAGGRTRAQDVAPNDGLLRYLKAKSTRPGATDSAFTTALSVDPWGITAPPAVVDASRAFVTMGNDSTLDNERALTEGPGIDVVDAGAGSTVTIKLRGITSLTTGDLYYALNSTDLVALPIGTVGQVLTSTGTVPVWGTPTGDVGISLGWGTNWGGSWGN